MLSFHFNTQNTSTAIKDTLKVKFSWLIVITGHLWDPTIGNMTDSGVIDIPHMDETQGITVKEDFKKIKVRNKRYKTEEFSQQELKKLQTQTTESQQINISSAAKTLNSTIKTSKDGDNAISTLSSQAHSFHESDVITGSNAAPTEAVEETETNKDDIAEHFEYEFDHYSYEPAYTSLNTQYETDADDSYYQQPFSSLIQEESSLLLNPSYNFSGLQVRVSC